MKKKSTSQSAFFNLRVLVGLFVALAGLSLALLATANPAGHSARAKRVVAPSPGKYKVTTKSSMDPLVPAAFDCSKIKQLGIDRQEVIRVCLQEGVPIYQGKIDKTLFQAQLEALGAMPQAH